MPQGVSFGWEADHWKVLAFKRHHTVKVETPPQVTQWQTLWRRHFVNLFTVLINCCTFQHLKTFGLAALSAFNASLWPKLSLHSAVILHYSCRASVQVKHCHNKQIPCYSHSLKLLWAQQWGCLQLSHFLTPDASVTFPLLLHQADTNLARRDTITGINTETRHPHMSADDAGRRYEYTS